MECQRTLIILLLAVWGAPAFSQQCNNHLPDSVHWTGGSKGFSRWNPGNSSEITISKVASGKYMISDLSAGFFLANNIPYEIQIEIELNCDFSVTPLNFLSDFGDGAIISGQWDPLARELKIQWAIPFNNLSETSTFLLQ